MVNSVITIPWNDGSEESITINIQEDSSGDIIMDITSPYNKSSSKRVKNISLSSHEHESVKLELSQEKDLYPPLGEMEVGISFIVRS